MVSTNRFPGLARGPLDHKASSVINQISNNAIDMGSTVELVTAIVASEILPRVSEFGTGAQGVSPYGIAVGGDVDGIYGDGSAASDDSTRATSGAGQGVVVVTRGRCLARVRGSQGGTNANIVVKAKLTQSNVAGLLEEAVSGDNVIAILLQPVASADLDMVAVDVGAQGVL